MLRFFFFQSSNVNTNISQECAVVGVEHPRLGEEVGVAIHPLPGQAGRLSLESVREACGDLAEFKKPVHIYIYDKQLPRGATVRNLGSSVFPELFPLYMYLNYNPSTFIEKNLLLQFLTGQSLEKTHQGAG